MSRFRAVVRVSLLGMLRSRALRIAAVLIALVPAVAAWWLRTSATGHELVAGIVRRGPVPTTAGQAGTAVSLIVLFTVYVFILACGSIITTSVALERTSKVSVMVFRHVSPLTIVVARLTALMIAMTSILGLVIAECALIGALGIVPVDSLAGALGLTSLSAGQLTVAAVCAVGGIWIFAVLYAAVGLFVRETAQLQYAQFPVTFLLILVFALSYVSVLNPGSTAAVAASWIPLTAPMVESGRIISGSSGAAEMAGSASGVVVLLVAVAVLIARVIVPRTTGRYSARTTLHTPTHRAR